MGKCELNKSSMREELSSKIRATEKDSPEEVNFAAGSWYGFFQTEKVVHPSMEKERDLRC